MNWATAVRVALLIACMTAMQASYSGASAARSNPAHWYVVAVDNRMAKDGTPLTGTLRFADGFTFDTHLYDVHLLSDKRDAGDGGYVFLLAKLCRSCGPGSFLYFYSRESGKLKLLADAAPGDHFGYPALNDPALSLALREHVYFGDCLPDHRSVVLVQTSGPEDLPKSMTWMYRSVPGNIEDDGELKETSMLDGIQSRIQEGSCLMLPERVMRASVNYTPMIAEAREPPAPSWVSYQLMGPRNHPFPIVYATTEPFRIYPPEELLQLSQIEYLALERLNRTWLTRPDCRSELPEADRNSLSIEVAQRQDGITTRCIIPRDLTCVYWSDLNGVGVVPTLRLGGGSMSTLAAEVGCSVH